MHPLQRNILKNQNYNSFDLGQLRLDGLLNERAQISVHFDFIKLQLSSFGLHFYERTSRPTDIRLVAQHSSRPFCKSKLAVTDGVLEDSFPLTRVASARSESQSDTKLQITSK